MIECWRHLNQGSKDSERGWNEYQLVLRTKQPLSARDIEKVFGSHTHNGGKFYRVEESSHGYIHTFTVIVDSSD